MQVTFAPGSSEGGQIGELEEKPGLSAGGWQMRPLSRGYAGCRWMNGTALLQRSRAQPIMPTVAVLRVLRAAAEGYELRKLRMRSGHVVP
jgi:hypothetical protein